MTDDLPPFRSFFIYVGKPLRQSPKFYNPKLFINLQETAVGLVRLTEHRHTKISGLLRRCLSLQCSYRSSGTASRMNLFFVGYTKQLHVTPKKTWISILQSDALLLYLKYCSRTTNRGSSVEVHPRPLLLPSKKQPGEKAKPNVALRHRSYSKRNRRCDLETLVFAERS